jgi:hypothetical protein
MRVGYGIAFTNNEQPPPGVPEINALRAKRGLGVSSR